MPRTSRSIHAGLYYHVLNRGNNRATVFRNPDDYDNFLQLIHRVQARQPVELVAACLMPNHFHFVLKPLASVDLAGWLHWLLTIHATRHHRHRDSSGRIWTGRFKAFPIQDDRHLLTVIRYVERNALRAQLVPRAEDWRWGSLAWRLWESSLVKLSPPPSPLPKNWIEFVNTPQTTAELAELRNCVRRGQPYGDTSWTRETAAMLGLKFTLARRGRPRRQPPPEISQSSSCVLETCALPK
ncbi:MAG: transposase [Gammaproteobacteria bacterium]